MENLFTRRVCISSCRCLFDFEWKDCGATVTASIASLHDEGRQLCFYKEENLTEKWNGKKYHT